ncbi:hypothetical protein M9Y10_012439 [Tritrichomonas musculus]|uniref:Right handed beta helix domain-containing protein n=1 Tax=Tritrichomonas musculus TaxID=1915356 RepID=A0ABR2IDP4_9EUKA
MEKNTLNGDGGALQLCYICKMNDMNVYFGDCIFKGNRAHRNGAAIAVQTYYDVTIERCIFEANIANAETSSQSVYNNYFDLKSQGRGGTVYVNPAYSYDESDGCQPPDIPMKICKVENSAYDGFAMYSEGDNPETKFTIKMNNFIDNYNENNHHSDSNSILGAAITTEICSITEEQISADNSFSYTKPIMVKNL